MWRKDDPREAKVHIPYFIVSDGSGASDAECAPGTVRSRDIELRALLSNEGFVNTDFLNGEDAWPTNWVWTEVPNIKEIKDVAQV